MEDLRAREAADQRVRALGGKRFWQCVVFGTALTMIFVVSILLEAFSTTSETGTRALDMDFRVFWSASRLAFAGEPLAAFDLDRLASEAGFASDRWMPWIYPPGFLLLILPLGAFSFATSLLLITIVSITLITVATRPFAAGNRAVWLAMALAPAYIATLVIGQNSVIWLAVLLLALAALRDGRWILAGLLIGCLTLKPQLGVMIAVALLAAGLWRTILSASITALVLGLVPTLLFGTTYWQLLADLTAQHGERVVKAVGNTDLMIGSLYLMVRAGIPGETALTLQTGLAVLCGFAVFLVWRSARSSFDVKAATLLCAILLSAPYLWFYEAALMPAIGLFLFRAGAIGTGSVQAAVLALLWIGAGLQAILVYLGVETRFPWAVIYVPLLAYCLWRCLTQVLILRRTPQPSV